MDLNEEPKFEKCSDNCVSCESKSRCLKCESEYFLNFNGFNNYSCVSCSEFYNCSTCMIANITQKIEYPDFDLINSIQTYKEYKSLYKWQIVCLSCEKNYFKKENFRCYKCSDEISDCAECIYISNNDNLERLDDRSFFEVITENYFIFCLSCNNDKNQVVYLEKTTNFFSSICEVCSSLIPNCKNCKGLFHIFGQDINMIFLMQPSSQLSLFLEATYKLRCLDCGENYLVHT